MSKSNTLTAAEIAEETMRRAKEAHTATLDEMHATETLLTSLNARLDQGDATVTVEAVEKAESAIRTLSRLAQGQAKTLRKAETAYKRATADLRLATAIASALSALPATDRGVYGHLHTHGLERFVAVPVDAIPEQRPTDSEGRTYYVSQDEPTKREGRTGIESGAVLLAVPSQIHIPYLADRWAGGAARAGIQIGERGHGFYGGRTLPNGGGESISLADGSDYTVHRIPVESARPDVPVITETSLPSDARDWINTLVQQIEHKASVEFRYGSPFQIARDARLAVRDIAAGERLEGDTMTRTASAAGQVSINPGDEFDDLEKFILVPVVEEWVQGTGIFDGIAAGLGRPKAIDVTVSPIGRGMADLAISASFVSTTE